MAIRPCAALAAGVFLLYAVATALYTAYPEPMNPCRSSLVRSLLGASRLDPYIVSCAAHHGALGGGALTAGSSSNTSIGGSLETSQETCALASLANAAVRYVYCCPPVATEIINFTFPDPAEPLRVRRPLHGIGAEGLAKYERLIGIMKALPRSDPRSFYQMANIHCAYCTGAYRQTGNASLAMQIHFSWFFFPFHRGYIYFFERIAAKLLGEPGYALPFWAWDVPGGMRIETPFDNSSSPLYDPVRNPDHVPPKVVDLAFFRNGTERNFTDEVQIQQNMYTMYKQMISNAALPSLFHGQPFRAGQHDKPGPGTVEMSPHNTVHTWTGNITQPGVENMGTYYSAGRDPLFYPHHNNIDRLWDAWRDIGAARGLRGHVDYTDPDWLDSSFLFYDEEARLIRITVRDVLHIDKLRYRYDGVDMPWANAVPPVTAGVNTKRGTLKSARFPVSLDAAVTAEVMRPRVLRSRREKEAEEEVLVVDGVQSDGSEVVKFDVFVNAMEYEKVEPGGRQMAGTYVSLSHPRMDGSGTWMPIETSMRVALNQLLEDLGADGDESVTVTLVPRSGKVKIGGLRIVYMVE